MIRWWKLRIRLLKLLFKIKYALKHGNAKEAHHFKQHLLTTIREEIDIQKNIVTEKPKKVSKSAKKKIKKILIKEAKKH